MLKSHLHTCCTFLIRSFVIDKKKQTTRKLCLKKVKFTSHFISRVDYPLILVEPLGLVNLDFHQYTWLDFNTQRADKMLSQDLVSPITKRRH